MVFAMQLLAAFVFAGGVGLAIAALSIAWMRRDPGISIQRGAPRDPAGDSWHV